MIFYDLTYKIACKLAPTKEAPDNSEVRAAIGIEGKVKKLRMNNIKVTGMRLMDVGADAELEDVKMRRIKVSLLPPPQHAPAWLRYLIDGTGFIASVIAIVPIVRYILEKLELAH